jgi:hypothetical protein
MGTRNRVGIGLSYRLPGGWPVSQPYSYLVPAPIDCSKISAGLADLSLHGAYLLDMKLIRKMMWHKENITFSCNKILKVNY